jgi:hypothetical protein
MRSIFPLGRFGKSVPPSTKTAMNTSLVAHAPSCWTQSRTQSRARYGSGIVCRQHRAPSNAQSARFGRLRIVSSIAAGAVAAVANTHDGAMRSRGKAHQCLRKWCAALPDEGRLASHVTHCVTVRHICDGPYSTPPSRHMSHRLIRCDRCDGATVG